MKKLFRYCYLVAGMALFGCATNEDIYAKALYSKAIVFHSEVPTLTFDKVDENGIVTMNYKSDKIYKVHAKAGQQLRWSDGNKMDYRVKSASFQEQEIVLEYIVKWGGSLL